jgi:hypothetical protein
MAEWKDFNDSQLADEVQAGLRGQGAIVESDATAETLK